MHAARRFPTTRLALAAAAAALLAGCPPPEPRPEGTADGSARWAYAIAQPAIAAWAPDAELRVVLGSGIMLDGRLPANTGAWSFVAYSAASAKELQVTVGADGGASTSERAEAAPGPGVVRPLPPGWADSTAVLRATDGHRDGGASIVQLAVLNFSSYPQAPGEAVWAIAFDVGATQLVRVDGTYLAAQ